MNGESRVQVVQRADAVKASEFQRFCAQVAALLGIQPRFVPRVTAFLLNLHRLPLVWFQFTSCDGCKDSFLRSPLPWAGQTLFAQLPSSAPGTADGSGPPPRIPRNLREALRSSAGRYVCVVEGAPPPALHGSEGIGRMMAVAAEVCSNARAVLCVGSCTATTALVAAASAAGAPALTDVFGLPAVHVPGCPPTPLVLAATLVAHLLTGVGGADELGEAAPERRRPAVEAPSRRRGGDLEGEAGQLCAASQ